MVTYDYLFKILLLGNYGVGKTTFFEKYFNLPESDRFEPCQSINFGAKSINLDAKEIKVQIWDTGSQERFREIPPSYHRRALGYILMFDIGFRKSFDDLESWLNQIKKKSTIPHQIILLGNNKTIGLAREVTNEEAVAFAEKHNIPYLEICAYEQINVTESVMELVRRIKSKIDSGAIQTEPIIRSDQVPLTWFNRVKNFFGLSN